MIVALKFVAKVVFPAALAVSMFMFKDHAGSQTGLILMLFIGCISAIFTLVEIFSYIKLKPKT